MISVSRTHWRFEKKSIDTSILDNIVTQELTGTDYSLSHQSWITFLILHRLYTDLQLYNLLPYITRIITYLEIGIELLDRSNCQLKIYYSLSFQKLTKKNSVLGRLYTVLEKKFCAFSDNRLTTYNKG